MDRDANRGDGANVVVDDDDFIPIVCVLEENGGKFNRQKYRMFRVIRSRGKSLSSGGFGVTIAAVAAATDGLSSSSSSSSSEYLFIEEVLFLHEKGYLHAMISLNNSQQEISAGTEAKQAEGEKNTELPKAIDGGGGGDNDGRTMARLDTSQLYQLLPSMGISFAIYRVYSHLRSQDFRVLRHDPDRYEILVRQLDGQRQQRRRCQEKDEEETKNNGNDEQTKEMEQSQQQQNEPQAKRKRTRASTHLRRAMRESIQNAEPPYIPFNINRTIDVNDNTDNSSSIVSGSTAGVANDNDKNINIRLCWDAYKPNSAFGKTQPGLPDFYVAATYFNVPTVRFTDITNLIRSSCNGLPLKVAAVSDSGTVVMFGITDYGVPSIKTNR